MQIQFPIEKVLFLDLLYRSNFPEGGISEQFHEGCKGLEDMNTDPHEETPVADLFLPIRLPPLTSISHSMTDTTCTQSFSK